MNTVHKHTESFNCVYFTGVNKLQDLMLNP